jgi:hypothetical protein
MFAAKCVEAKTAEEIEQIQTKEGLIRRLQELSPYSVVITKTLSLARHLELDSEHTFALMAYHALVSAEKTKEALIEHMKVCNAPRVIPADAQKAPHEAGQGEHKEAV